MTSTLDQQLNQAILEGKSGEAFEQFYADDVVMQENSEPPCHGKAANAKRGDEWVASIETFHGGKLLGSAVNGDRTYSEWEFDVTFKNGPRVKLCETAVRQWNNGKVQQERFYYTK